MAIALAAVTQAGCSTEGTGNGDNQLSLTSAEVLDLKRSVRTDLAVEVAIGPGSNSRQPTVVATVSNAGPNVAFETLLTISLPSGVQVVMTDPSGICTQTERDVSCNLGIVTDIGERSQKALQIGLAVDPDVALPVTASALVTAEYLDLDNDLHPANNTATIDLPQG